MKWRYRGKFHLQGRLKHAKDYSVVDGGQGVEGKGVKYVGDGAVVYRIIFSRNSNQFTLELSRHTLNT